MLLHGYTTIEFREKRNGRAGAKTTASGARVAELFRQSPYDLGPLDNVKAVLGPNASLWLIPTRLGMPSGPRAGCVYRVRPDHPLALNAAAPPAYSSAPAHPLPPARAASSDATSAAANSARNESLVHL